MVKLYCTTIDVAESMTAIERTDDGSNESIYSPKSADRSVLNGIGKMRKVDKVTLHVALKNTTKSSVFHGLPHVDPP